MFETALGRNNFFFTAKTNIEIWPKIELDALFPLCPLLDKSPGLTAHIASCKRDGIL